MEYCQLPESDITISRIILGTWAIGGDHWGNYDESNAIIAIETAIGNGITTIDTAPVYGKGHAEKLVGQVIKKQRDKVIIASKCGLDTRYRFRTDLSPSFIEEDLDNSLRRLQTDYIDIYQCHWPDRNNSFDKTLETLISLKNKGKIRYIGLSNYNLDDIEKAVGKLKHFTMQNPYSLLDRSIETDLTDVCIKHNLSLLTYGSLAGGMLTGKYTEWKEFSRDDVRSFFYKSFQKRNWEKVQACLRTINEMAKIKGVFPANISIKWLLKQPAVSAAIVGAKNKEQVLINIDSINVLLDDNECDLLRMSSNML